MLLLGPEDCVSPTKIYPSMSLWLSGPIHGYLPHTHNTIMTGSGQNIKLLQRFPFPCFAFFEIVSEEKIFLIIFPAVSLILSKTFHKVEYISFCRQKLHKLD